MARRVYFSFHYDDIWKVNQIRNSHVVEGCSAAGFIDSSLWEEVKRKGDTAIKKAIEEGLNGTSVSCVLIGRKTWARKYVNYEIRRSIERGNGLLGIYIDKIKSKSGQTEQRGPIPKLLKESGAPIYVWNRNKFADWVSDAARKSPRGSPRAERSFLTWLRDVLS